MSVIISKTKIIGTSPIPAQTWDRPSDWLTMPTLAQGDEKIYYLVKVYEDGENYHLIEILGDYTVDWGDGTAVENYSSGANAEHSFDWNNAPLSSLTSDGFKQVIVTVTPQSGSTLTGINRPDAPYYATGDTLRGGNNSVISVKMAGTGFTSLLQGFLNYNSLEEFEYVGTAPNLVNVSQIFSSCTNLKKVIQFDLSNVTDLSNSFVHCFALVSLPQLDTSSCTNFTSTFYNCYNIDYIPPIVVTAATSLPSTFGNCRNLKASPISDYTGIATFSATFNQCKFKVFEATLPNATNCYQMFIGCSNLEVVKLTIPNNQLTNIGYMFSSCNQLKEIKPFDTSAVTLFNHAFQGHQFITDYGWVDTSSGVNFQNMFASNNIRDASFLNITSSATNVTNLFSSAYKLEKLPSSFDCTNISALNSMFVNCFTLRTPPNLINTANITSTYQLFYHCYNLRQAPTINGTIANAQQMFASNRTLEKIPAYDLSGCNSGNETYQFAAGAMNLRESLVTDNTSKMDYSSTALSTAKIVEIFTNLGTIPSGTAVINVSNCPGSAALTPANKLIAQNKGWTVTS